MGFPGLVCSNFQITGPMVLGHPEMNVGPTSAALGRTRTRPPEGRAQPERFTKRYLTGPAPVEEKGLDPSTHAV